MESLLKSLLTLSLNLLAIQWCWCHPSGAPTSVCHDLIPKHNAQPQTSPSPYVLSAHVINGTEVHLTIEASENDFFKGFAIQARRTNASHEALGKFVVTGNDAHAINCYNQNENAFNLHANFYKNTITHSHRQDKQKLLVRWVAPNELEEGTEVVFFGTVLKNTKTFWTEQSSAPFRVGINKAGAGGAVDDHNDHKKAGDQHSSNVRNSCANKYADYLLVSAVFMLFYRKI